MGSAAAQARTGARDLIVTQSRTEGGRGENLASLLLSLSLHQYHHWLTRSLLKEETGKCSFQGKDRKWSRSMASMPCLNFFSQDYVFSCATPHGTEFLMVEVDDTKQLIRLSLAETSCSLNKHWLKAHSI